MTTHWKTIGNAATWAACDRVDVIPLDDLIDHDTETDDCMCGPRVEHCPRGDGSDGWIRIHWSLDGRRTENYR